VVASYYVFVDVCLVTQYFWYTYFKPRLEGGSLHSAGSSDFESDADSEIINGLSPIHSNFSDQEPHGKKDDDTKTFKPSPPMDTPHFSEIRYEKGTPRSTSSIFRTTDKASSSWNPIPSPRTVLYIATLCALVSGTSATPTPFLPPPKPLTHNLLLFRVDTPTEIAGTVLSWSSTLLYLGSRLPQLYKNWTRQSTAGLSPLLFFAAFCGNFFYSASLLTNPNAWFDFPAYGGHGWAGPEASQRWEWVARAAPFFLGAAGVLGLDACMGVQFMLYGEMDEEKLVKVRSRDGRTHWERVSGWMRGWVPSIKGKERVVDLAESQRLLSSSRELDRSMSSSRREYEYGAM